MRAFLSSTFVDLELHRLAVVAAIERLRQHVGRMEVMGAQPTEPTTACLAEIDTCDLFIGVYAHRYGFVPASSKTSITELEFEHARRGGKPIFCFLVDEKHQWPPAMIEQGLGAASLVTFKQTIRKRVVVDIFTTPENLALKVATALWSYLLTRRSLAVHTMAVVLLALVASFVGGAFWFFFFKGLGGSTEPHGIASILWPLVTNLPSVLLFFLFQRTPFSRLRADYFDAITFLLGLIVASWFFYDYPFVGSTGCRNTIHAFGWSFFQEEAVLVLLWSGCLSVGAFLPSLLRRLTEDISDAARAAGVFALQCLLVIVPTSIVTVVFVDYSPTPEYETARGILAGIFLRLGLALGLAVVWTEWTSVWCPKRPNE